MPAPYDDQGNYVYPEGFDSESGEWLEGFDSQREEWERQYAEARSRYEAHQQQVVEARSKAEAAAEEAGEEGEAREHHTTSSSGDSERVGTLASDEALAALRDKLSGGQS